LLASVTAVAVSERRVSFSFEPSRTLLADIRSAKRPGGPVADSETIRVYYLSLARLDKSYVGSGPVPLGKYLAAVFELAHNRSVNRDPARENRAALLALGLYFGDEHLRLLSGVRTEDLGDNGAISEDVQIHSRHDLVQHFLTSAGLELLEG